MTGKELIQELLKLDTQSLDKEVKLYSLIPMDHIDIDENEFEFVDEIVELDYNDKNGCIFLCGEY